MYKGLSVTLTMFVLIAAAGTSILIDHASAEPNKVEKAAAAKISMVEAITIASEKVSGAVIEAKLEQKHDRLIWEVEIVTPEKQVMEIHLDAQTGIVIDVEREKLKPKRGHGRN